MGDFTFGLFARPSFLEGVGRLIDFGGTLNEYNTSATPDEADYQALASDWWAIGNELRTAMKEFEAEYAGESE